MTNGSISSLPEETLDQIFSSNLQQHDLAVLCRVSKQFNNIVKPLLYRSITLYSVEQAEKFKKNKSGAAQLVESILITGKADAWKDDDIMNIYDAIRELTEIEKRKKELGLVKKVVEGEIVNPSQIKSLFIHQVFEDADALWKKDFSVNHQIFANLTDLSIVGHRGGAAVLSEFFQQCFIPSLKRLVLCDVSEFRNRVPPSPTVVTSHNSSGPQPPTVRSLEIHPIEGDPLRAYLQGAISSGDFKLDLLVSPSYDFLGHHPSLLHLAILDYDNSILASAKYAVVYISPRSTFRRTEFDRVFIELAYIANNYSSYSLKYLALPSKFEQQLSVNNHKILNDLLNLSVTVHFDGDLGSVIAPPSFFEFRKKEEEEQARMKEEEIGGVNKR
ncbi:hypothetical protein JCM3765_004609 [Sporobolomyces pararoseus]